MCHGAVAEFLLPGGSLLKGVFVSLDLRYLYGPFYETAAGVG